MVLQSNISDEVARITRVIEKAYGSLSDPSLEFVRARIASKPYQGLLAELEARFEVFDTELEYGGVAMDLHLIRGPWRMPLSLSLVGKYAMLCRGAQLLPSRHWPGIPLIWDESHTRSNKEAFVLNALRRHGIETPPPEVLETRIPFRLETWDTCDYSIYHCLFDVFTPFPDEFSLGYRC